MLEHRLRVHASHGQNASLYLPECSCDWAGGDCRSEEEAREEFAEHVAGKVPAWIMREGQVPGWEGAGSEKRS
ncbi:MAG: hypothetical protein ACM3NV_00025 [Syntrophothermus sp.]